MTAREMAKALIDRTDSNGNREGFVHFNKLKVKVRVIDFRKAFGRDDVLITPVAGSGEQWVDITSLRPE